MAKKKASNIKNWIVFIFELIVLIPLCILFFNTLHLLSCNSPEAIAGVITVPIVLVLLAIETLLNIIGLGVAFRSRTWYWILIELLAFGCDMAMIIKLCVLIN